MFRAPRHLTRRAAILGGVSLLCGTDAFAADRQTQLEAGARNERIVTLYTTGTQIQPLLDRFQRRYPYLRVQTYNAGPNEVASKAIQEYAAARYDVDGFELDSSGILAMKDAGVVKPLSSPEMTAYPANAIAPGRYWVSVRESYVGLGWNTSLLEGQDVPRTYRDLLAPRWKGKLAINGTVATAAQWIGAMEIVEGADFIRSLAAQDIRVYQVTARALANLIVSGEVPLSPTIYSSHVAESRRQGAAIAWRALGPAVVSDTAVAIAARAPHPNAMLLLTDFLLSREGQQLYQQLGYSTTRRDVQTPATISVRKLYLTRRPTYFADFKQWAALYQQLFLR